MNRVNVLSKRIKGYEQSEFSYTLIEQKKRSNHLAIILPGMGYSVHKSLLHFVTNFFITENYDVLL